MKLLLLFIRRKVYDEYNDEEVELTKEEIDMIRRLRQGKIPHAEVNPYEVGNADQFSYCLPVNFFAVIVLLTHVTTVL